MSVEFKDNVSTPSVSFTFTDVTESPNSELKVTSAKVKEVLEKDSRFFQPGDQFLFATENEQAVRARFNHGLLGTIYHAYSTHTPLVVRPDDLWLAISVAFGHYVEKHAEEMRSCFVEHEGKRQLVVKVLSPFLEYTTIEHWDGFLELMSGEIEKAVKGDMVDWIVPDFSTTTTLDRTVGRVVLMGALKEYFDFKFELSCGLSRVTLEGTLVDWEKLVEKARGLYRFNQDTLNQWADVLVPVLEKFVSAYKGEVDSDFWQRICTSTIRGSGGQEALRGWFLVFSPFNESGKYLLNSQKEIEQTHVYGHVADDDIVDCKISVPVLIDDHGTEYQTRFVAGSVTSLYDKEQHQLRPNPSWGIVMTKRYEFRHMEERLESILERRMYQKPDEMDKTRCRKLLQFAYHTAQQFYFPNDSLFDLTDTIISYYFTHRYDRPNPKTITEDGDLYREYLRVLGKGPVGFSSQRSFTSYVVLERVVEVVDAFLSEKL